ncbi:hypothetical protein WN48_03507 [Eufriesea mexicana]|uniref:Uncharacterized protein n=1 Tax=Eufriesea mexicana TaxID=516756 RepID=A0A310SFA5_9HYME|nr:PREDICTED: uncharacterized protein LOC108549443 [Eufriesea mexicana]OAD56381.1 hypothetical protein WN48_03507 [Eufriesea mexicana]
MEIALTRSVYPSLAKFNATDYRIEVCFIHGLHGGLGILDASCIQSFDNVLLINAIRRDNVADGKRGMIEDFLYSFFLLLVSQGIVFVMKTGFFYDFRAILTLPYFHFELFKEISVQSLWSD